MPKTISGHTNVIKEVTITENTAATESEKPKLGRGRPKTKPSSKLASFHLPLDLIAKIDSEAVKISAGNKSQLVINILENYFSTTDSFSG